MTQIKLTVNEEKTRVCRVPNETFDFLGYTFGRCYSPKTGRAYLGTRPSRKSIRWVIQRPHAETDRRTGIAHFLYDTSMLLIARDVLKAVKACRVRMDSSTTFPY
jgi:hypothetical protein